MTELKPLAGPRLSRSGRLIPAGLDEGTIAAVVADFYGKARLDDLLGPVFRAAIPDEQWPLHLAVIVDFWSSMLLGTGRYQGRPMTVHLALRGLNDRHFMRSKRFVRQRSPPSSSTGPNGSQTAFGSAWPCSAVTTAASSCRCGRRPRRLTS
jgi:hemoglobin